MNAEELENIDDELLVLARDARASRKRTNRWTTGLIIAGMGASTAYVVTVNEQINSLTSQAAEAEDAKNERDNLRAQRDLYKNFADQFGDMYPMLSLADRIPPVIKIEDDSGNGNIRNEKGDTEWALSNVVWVVDGSRRFPMTDGDILWVPESDFWLQLNSTEAPAGDAGDDDAAAAVVDESPPRHGHKLTLYSEERPSSDPDEQGIDIEENPYRQTVTKGVFRCVEVMLHGQSNRPGFTVGDYVDVEILYTRESCPGENN